MSAKTGKKCTTEEDQYRTENDQQYMEAQNLRSTVESNRVAIFYSILRDIGS